MHRYLTVIQYVTSCFIQLGVLIHVYAFSYGNWAGDLSVESQLLWPGSCVN